MVPALPMELVARVTPAPEPRRSLSLRSRTRLAAAALVEMVTVELTAVLLSMRASVEASGAPADQLGNSTNHGAPFQVVVALRSRGCRGRGDEDRQAHTRWRHVNASMGMACGK